MIQYSNILRTKGDSPFISSPKGNDFSGLNYYKLNKIVTILILAFIMLSCSKIAEVPLPNVDYTLEEEKVFYSKKGQKAYNILKEYFDEDFPAPKREGEYIDKTYVTDKYSSIEELEESLEYFGTYIDKNGGSFIESGAEIKDKSGVITINDTDIDIEKDRKGRYYAILYYSIPEDADMLIRLDDALINYLLYKDIDSHKDDTNVIHKPCNT